MYIIAGLFKILHKHFGVGDIASIFREFDTDITVLSNPLAQIRIDILGAYLETVAASTHNHRIGLEAGFQIPFTQPAIHFNLYKECHTVRDLFAKLHEMESVTNDFTTHTTRLDSDSLYYEVSVHPYFTENYPKASRIWVEMQYGMALQYAYSYTGRYHFPIAVHSIYPQEHTPDKLEQYIHCPVYFSQPKTGLVFDRSVLDIPVMPFKKELVPLFEDTMGALQLLHRQQHLSSATRRFIVHNLSTPSFNLHTVATRFHMSERTYQRKLKLEGYTYQHILDEVRMTLSKKYIRAQVPFTEIAYLLGFSSQSAFNKFYKKHFGVSPRV